MFKKINYLVTIIIISFKLYYHQSNNDNEFYTITVVKALKPIVSVCYRGRYEDRAKTRGHLLFLGYAMCSDSLNTCLTLIKSECKFNHIPTKNIFAKVFYSTELLLKVEMNEIEQMMKDDSAQIKNYLSLEVMESQEFLTAHKSALNIFLSSNLYAQNGVSLDPVIMMSNSVLSIIFPTETPHIYNKNFVSTFEFQNNTYSVFAAYFICSDIKNILILVHQVVLKRHIKHGNYQFTNISHPCILFNYIYKINPHQLYSYCGNYLDLRHLPNEVTFHGAFNAEKCTDILRSIIYDKSYCKRIKNCNLSNLKIPLFNIQNSNAALQIHIDNSQLPINNVEQFIDHLNSIKQFCKKESYLETIVAFDIHCFRPIYMLELLLNTININPLAKIKIQPRPNFLLSSLKTILLHDPRIAIHLRHAPISTRKPQLKIITPYFLYEWKIKKKLCSKKLLAAIVFIVAVIVAVFCIVIYWIILKKKYAFQ